MASVEFTKTGEFYYHGPPRGRQPTLQDPDFIFYDNGTEAVGLTTGTPGPGGNYCKIEDPGTLANILALAGREDLALKIREKLGGRE
jgi:hypothetical protein